MIKEHNGDILKAPVKIIVHQANCQNAMASGIAKLLRATYPEVYDADTEAAKAKENKLGNVSFTETKDGKFLVINLYGQLFPGTDSRKTNYEAYHNGLEKVKIIGEELDYPTIGIPYLMGCGLAGGNWTICETIIKEVFKDYKGDVLICRLEYSGTFNLDNQYIVTEKTIDVIERRETDLIDKVSEFIVDNNITDYEWDVIDEFVTKMMDMSNE
jgi:O-acetyl-ADP-ribose deacetylase (regulator of RNase III)